MMYSLCVCVKVFFFSFNSNCYFRLSWCAKETEKTDID